MKPVGGTGGPFAAGTELMTFSSVFCSFFIISESLVKLYMCASFHENLSCIRAFALQEMHLLGMLVQCNCYVFFSSFRFWYYHVS